MSMSRSQPHGQPNLGSVKVPYTSSVVTTSGRPGTFTAEWPFAHSFRQLLGTARGSAGVCPHTGLLTGEVMRSPLRDSTSPGVVFFTTDAVFKMRNWPASIERKARVPSAETLIEWRNRLQSYGPHVWLEAQTSGES